MSSNFSDEDIRNKISHLLSIYPVISPTMLQAGLGPNYKPMYWRPVLNSMIEDGEVVQEFDNRTNADGRSNTYTKLLLPQTQVAIGEDTHADANT